MILQRNLYIIFIIFLAIISGCVRLGNKAVNTAATNSSQNILPEKPIDTEPVVSGFDYINYVPTQTNVTYQLLTKFPIARSPMPYYISNTTEINQYKYDLTVKNIRDAFDLWENATRFKVKFERVNSQPKEGIIISLVLDLNGTKVGEARPIFYPFESYSLIIGGEMSLEPLYGGSENRAQVTHEIGHILGFDHNNNSHSILFPYVAYSQVITDDTINALDILYKDVPSANKTLIKSKPDTHCSGGRATCET